MIQKIVVPDIGENVVSGKVVAVHIKVGQGVDVDDTVLELETDKAVVEIPSPVKGRIVAIMAREGDELKVDDVIATVETDRPADGAAAPRPAGDAVSAPAEPAQKAPEEAPRPSAREPAPAALKPLPDGQAGKPAEAEARPTPQAREMAGRPLPASPAIRRMARELGVRIETLQGSGPGGRITESDIKTHVRKDREAAQSGLAISKTAPAPLADFSRWGPVETIELETVRRLTADSTAASWAAIPHVTQFDKADITAIQGFVKKNAPVVAQTGGKLTLTPILTKVCAQALKKYPRFNTSLDLANQRLIFKQYVHIGIAVDTPRGLLMPVIRNADTKSITDLAREIVDLAARARNRKIKSAELEGGGFSISNQGGIGGVAFTPIILWPQVAILGMSRSIVEPVFLDGGFQPRSMLPLALSYDHRVIDGADAARFLRWICDCLEQPLTILL
jgi:pyruvate dehydrogenase E2 component (dihydrolipoyllysine-residue acetyltransferase)